MDYRLRTERQIYAAKKNMDLIKIMTVNKARHMKNTHASRGRPFNWPRGRALFFYFSDFIHGQIWNEFRLLSMLPVKLIWLDFKKWQTVFLRRGQTQDLGVNQFVCASRAISGSRGTCLTLWLWWAASSTHSWSSSR